MATSTRLRPFPLPLPSPHFTVWLMHLGRINQTVELNIDFTKSERARSWCCPFFGLPNSECLGQRMRISMVLTSTRIVRCFNCHSDRSERYNHFCSSASCFDLATSLFNSTVWCMHPLNLWS